MSTLTRHEFFKSSHHHGGLAAGRSPAAVAGALLRHAWQRLKAWRIERRAIGDLSRLDDRELRDMGISRFEIEAAARGTLGRRGRRA